MTKMESEHSSLTTNTNSDDSIEEIDANLANISLKRRLPIHNVKEKIVIALDIAEDENCTPFSLNSQEVKPLEMLKQAITMFLRRKHLISDKHEYALAILNETGVEWLVDFTAKIDKIIKTLESISACETEDIFPIDLLFEEILKNVNVPEVQEEEDTILPPPYIVRTILFYGRSYTMPTMKISDSVNRLLKEDPYFTLDVVVAHEAADVATNSQKIFDELQKLDVKGFAYSLAVGRDPKSLFNSVAKLLGHPLQRPTQKFANYTIKQL